MTFISHLVAKISSRRQRARIQGPETWAVEAQRNKGLVLLFLYEKRIIAGISKKALITQCTLIKVDGGWSDCFVISEDWGWDACVYF